MWENMITFANPKVKYAKKQTSLNYGTHFIIFHAQIDN